MIGLDNWTKMKDTNLQPCADIIFCGVLYCGSK